MFNMVLNGLQWSQMVLNGLKKIYHTFNRMAFITRFNLVLVWSKIVKLLTIKSSKWVRHNQVSWSSFFGQRGEAYRWRVCYQLGLPCFFFIYKSLDRTIKSWYLFSSIVTNQSSKFIVRVTAPQW